MLMFNADELFERLGLTVRCEDCEHRNKYCGDVRCEDGTWAQVCDVLDHMKLIDAVPVVRCKDCVYRVIVRDPLMKTMDCYGCKVMHYNEDDWFCSFGERKDDGRTCDTCKHYDKGWDDIICDGCTKAHSNWERKDDE